MAAVAARLFQNWRASSAPVLLTHARNASVLCHKLEFKDYGNPLEVISKVEEEVSDDLEPKQVLVKMLAAPLNPADINTVQGTYAVKPDSFPAVLGNEGLGEVVACGSKVTQMEPGDWVIPFLNEFGTCRSHAVAAEEDVVKIRNTVPLVEAATLSVNPCTAFRMLHDFVRLEEDDVVIQNGANSAVGQAVIQLCRVYGYRSVNVVRAREDLEEVRQHLTGLGATVVLTEEELRTTPLFRSGDLPKPRLGLNCVGGASATEVARQLATSGTLVTYGAMSRAPLTVPTAQLIFRDLRVRAFWMTRWTRQHSVARARWEMLDELQTLCEHKYLRAPRYQLVHIDDWRQAVSRTMPGGGRVGAKQILTFDRQLTV
ncbi:enoyl-[acyl-carrier-protein] reductase, mitochondrial-like [Pollicipes pollicipes]|uniref:enoyl-[acyl-carrier-protein] reductase, mitochondrial-like n=1 Tax=Pollicipes pollicipes TaxID=41117 RepID=UPI0018857AFD|nr:enoyl-[acyl-carrier-protein] reductase, mitochondrial-like [Pollicipes pollicipes]